MAWTKRGYLLLIIVLIGLSSLRADEDITEAISDTTDAITAQIADETKDSLKSDRIDNDEEQEEVEAEKNPTVQRLPADSETIRRNIVDSQFSCDEREPGFYADIDNDCQIFHRCVPDRREVFSFICPEQTVFDQRILVCILDDDYDMECEKSEQYYRESNRAFFGNATAEENIEENLKNSQEITQSVEVFEPQTVTPAKEDVKLFEIVPAVAAELSVAPDNSAMIEKNSLEEEREVESVSDENDYQAELIPSSSNHFDASLATSSNSEVLDSTEEISTSEASESIEPPKKIITLSVFDPIIEMPSNDDETTSRSIRKRSSSHRRRFLFRADAHK